MHTTRQRNGMAAKKHGNTTTHLTVREDAHVVPVHHAARNALHAVEDLLLRRPGGVRLVELHRSAALGAVLDDDSAAPWRKRARNARVRTRFLEREARAAAAEHSDVALQLDDFVVHLALLVAEDERLLQLDLRVALRRSGLLERRCVLLPQRVDRRLERGGRVDIVKDVRGSESNCEQDSRKM